MALFDFSWSGLAEIQRMTEELDALLNRNLRAAVARSVLWGAGEIAEDAPVDTGQLRASIGGFVVDTSFGKGASGKSSSLTRIEELTGVIGTAVEHAIYQEFGFTATGPKKLTPKQLRFLFAVGILRRGPGGRVIPGDRQTTQTYYRSHRGQNRKVRRRYTTAGVNAAINRRAGIKTRVKGRGFFRRNIPAIRQYFERACVQAVEMALQGREMPMSY